MPEIEILLFGGLKPRSMILDEIKAMREHYNRQAGETGRSFNA